MDEALPRPVPRNRVKKELIMKYNGSIIFGVGGITHTFLIAINIETKKRDIVPKILYNVIG